jgi:peptide/nickel transport system substrate-binding protein/microcin C transport system substrate-binding protein
MRRPLFKDIRVREAIGLSYDFETSNKTHVFIRANSEFNNSEFAAQGLPGPGELKLLEPFRAELPAATFGPAFVCPSTSSDPGALRRNLLRARTLLEQAGWKLAVDGKLRNAAGEAFEFEYLTPGEAGINDWQRNLAKLGVTLKERNVDFALYRRRLQAYDYDMVGIAGGTFTLPVASDMASLFGSKSADEPGNSNFRGIKSRAMDAMIAAMASAATLDELRDAARALDRVLMWNHYQVPEFYKASENFSYWNRFGMPATQAKYFSVDMLIGGFVEWGPWPLWTWWDKSLEKKKA